MDTEKLGEIKHIVKLRLGDCLTIMRKMKSNSIDSIVTDPPYGISFMGKKWDYEIPSVEVWREALRILKPGGYLLCFASTRTSHRMTCNIEDAGFEIRDTIAWVYGSGFPKSHNISKAIDKESRFEKEAKQWDGWGTALKPAFEPITVARKPLSEKTIAKNVLKWGTGGINIDGCRVEYNPEDHVLKYKGYSDGKYKSKYKNGSSYKHGTQVQINKQGRFPANFIHDGSEEVERLFPKTKSGKDKNPTKGDVSGFFGNKEMKYSAEANYGDQGSASRFFYCAKASKKDRNEGCELLNNQKFTAGNYSQSPTCKTCNKTLNGTNDHSKCSGEVYYKEMKSKNIGNNHPTVKPTQLMRYLVRLVTPINGIVLDPYMGSGSTGKACILEKLSFKGIEKKIEYFKIAKVRIKAEMEKKNA